MFSLRKGSDTNAMIASVVKLKKTLSQDLRSVDLTRDFSLLPFQTFYFPSIFIFKIESTKTTFKLGIPNFEPAVQYLNYNGN